MKDHPSCQTISSETIPYTFLHSWTLDKRRAGTPPLRLLLVRVRLGGGGTLFWGIYSFLLLFPWDFWLLTPNLTKAKLKIPGIFMIFIQIQTSLLFIKIQTSMWSKQTTQIPIKCLKSLSMNWDWLCYYVTGKNVSVNKYVIKCDVNHSASLFLSPCLSGYLYS